MTYKFGDATGTIGSDLGTSHAWTVPLSLASQIPSGTSGSCTITCKTYNGSTLIGTKTVSFTAKVPSSVVPTISSVAVADTNSAYATKFVSLVQGKSKAKFTITASGTYGSTIKTYKTVIEGKTYAGATPTTSVLTSSGNISASITVTDSRGRNATYTKTFYLIPYTSPKITTFDATRTDATGVPYYEGTNAKINVGFTISSANEKNTSSYSIEYKPSTGTTWTKLQSGSGYSYTNSIVTGALFDSNSTYDIKLTVTDYFGSVTRTIELPTAFTLLDFNANGKALAFGKVSELTEGVEFALPTVFNNAETPSSPKYLQGGENFNNILTPGFYLVPNTSISATLLNKPWTSNATGGLIVLAEGDGIGKCQIAHSLSKDAGCIYERSYYENAWGEWSIVHNGGGKILWTGAYYMTAEHKAQLSEPITSQPNGIVLTFSRFADGAALENNYIHFFIPKEFIVQKNGFGHTFFLAANRFAAVGTKYLYVNNTQITGHADNNLTGTANGITFNNAGFVLRYVIGV